MASVVVRSFDTATVAPAATLPAAEAFAVAVVSTWLTALIDSEPAVWMRETVAGVSPVAAPRCTPAMLATSVTATIASPFRLASAEPGVATALVMDCAPICTLPLAGPEVTVVAIAAPLCASTLALELERSTATEVGTVL